VQMAIGSIHERVLACVVGWTVILSASSALAAPSVVEPDSVTLVASDGVKIAGYWFDCLDDDAPAILLLHNRGSDHFGWRSLWPPLQRMGYHVLAIDFRGHGESRKLAPDKYEMVVQQDPAVYHEMLLDCAAALHFLEHDKKVPTNRIVIVGGEMGCTLGFALMAQEPRLAAMVAIGPGLVEFGFQTRKLIEKYGTRPLLVVTTKDDLDRGPQATVDALRGKAPVQLEVWPGTQVRGTQMLGRGEVERVVLEWLRKTIPPAR